MDSYEDVVCWFKQLHNAGRIEMMCDLFSSCVIFEWRFFISYLLGMCKTENIKVKLAEDEANDPLNSKNWTKLEDPTTRSRLIVSMCLLSNHNYICAESIYDFMFENFRGQKINWEKIFSNNNALEQTQLLLTLAANHPLFTFHQRTYFFKLLQYLAEHEQVQNVTPPNTSDQEPIPMQRNGNLPPQNDTHVKKTASPVVKKEPVSLKAERSSEKDIAVDTKENAILPVKVTTPILKKDCRNGESNEDSSSGQNNGVKSAPLKEKQNIQPAEGSSSNRSKASEKFNQVKKSESIKPTGWLSSDPKEGEKNVPNENLSSLRKSVTEKPTPVTPAIIIRPIAKRSGKIRNLEFKGFGKKGTHKIEVTWSSGKKTEVLKTLKELQKFQDTVTVLCSKFSQNEVNNTSLEGLGAFMSNTNEDIIRQTDSLCIYLSNFLELLPFSVRDHESVINYFQPHNTQPHRPILVGQGNLNHSPFTEKQNVELQFNPPFRNRNYEKRGGYHSRQYRNSSISFGSPRTSPSCNSPRNGNPVSNRGFRQARWKAYPPISGSSNTCSPQHSNSGSSQNSRSSSVENKGTPIIERSSKFRASKNEVFASETPKHNEMKASATEPRYSHNGDNKGDFQKSAFIRRNRNI